TGQQLLQDMGGTVCLECPDLHFAESLSAELRLTSERLLGDKRVRADRPCVYLVVYQVRKLEHIDVTDGYFLLELFTREAVIKTRLARWAYRIRKVEFIEPFVCLADVFLDLRLARSVKDGRREVQPEYTCGPAEMRFKDLADVHTRRHAERVENY